MIWRCYEAVLPQESSTNSDVSYQSGDQISRVHYIRHSLGHSPGFREEGRPGQKSLKTRG